MNLYFEQRLVWPEGRPRVDVASPSRFAERSTAQTADELELELARIGADSATVYSEMPIGKSGRPRDGWRRSDDHGVSVVFTRKGAEFVIAIDKWDHPRCNMRAITLCIEWLRGLERHGGQALTDQALHGFAQLPERRSRWWQVLEVPQTASLADAEQQYRILAKLHHPDAPGGDAKRMSEINAAIAAAREAFTNGH